MKFMQMLGEMSNWDKDKRFMAANDIAHEISTSAIPLDRSHGNEVCKAFLSQLEDQSIEVQGNAVRCLAKIVDKFGDDQIAEVLHRLSHMVLHAPAQIRDIYATCLKGLLLELKQSQQSDLCVVVIPRLLSGLEENANADKTQDGTIKEECVELLDEILRSPAASQYSLDHQSAGNTLLSLLSSSEYRLSLRKKAISCLGSLSHIMPDAYLSTLLCTLLGQFRAAGNKADRQTYVRAIGTVGRCVGDRIGCYLEELVHLLFDICEREVDKMNHTDADEDIDIIEISLNALETLVRKCPSKMRTYLDRLLAACCNLMSYDPNFYESSADEDFESSLEEECEDFAQSDEDDDASWKVRRASVKVLSVVVQSYPEQLERLYKELTAKLIGRFREREEGVRLDIFAAMEEMFKSAVKPSEFSTSTRRTALPSSVEAMPSLGGECLPQTPCGNLTQFAPTKRAVASCLLEELKKREFVKALLKHLKGASWKSRHAALQLLKVFSQNLPDEFEPHLPEMHDELLYCLKASCNAVKLDALEILCLQAENCQNPVVFKEMAPTIFPAVVQLVNDPYYRVQAQALKVCGVYTYTMKPSSEITLDAAMETLLLRLFESLHVLMCAAEIDQEVKEAALSCFATSVSVVGNMPMFRKQLTDTLVPFLDRLKNEATRKAAVSALKIICSSPEVIDIQVAIQPVISALSNMVHVQGRTFVQLCLTVLVSIVKKYGKGTEPAILCRIQTDGLQCIEERDLLLADLALQLMCACMQASPIVAETVAKDCWPGVALFCQSSALQGHALQSVLDFLAEALKHPDSFSLKKLMEDLSQIDSCSNRHSPHVLRQVLANLSKCLAQIVVLANSKSEQREAIDIWLQRIERRAMQSSGDLLLTHHEIVELELSVLALGETGILVDLGTDSRCLDAFLSLFSSLHEEIRSASAVALGYASCGSMKYFLGFIVKKIDSETAYHKENRNGANNEYKLRGTDESPACVARSMERMNYLLLKSLRQFVISQCCGGNDSNDVRKLQQHVVGGGQPTLKHPLKQQLEDHLLPHIPSLLHVLARFASSAEDADRLVVADCLGMLMTIAPELVANSVLSLCDCPEEPAQKRAKATALVAIRSAGNGCGAKIMSQFRVPLLSALEDADLVVRRESLLTLAALCASRTASSCLDDPAIHNSLVTLLLTRASVDTSLIREVDLGAFKHTVDEGLPVRKAAVSALSSLICSFPESVLAAPNVVDVIIVSLDDHEDVQALACQLLMAIAKLGNDAANALLCRALDAIDKSLTKTLRHLETGQDERNQDCVRLLSRTLRCLSEIAEISQTQTLQELMLRLAKNRIYQALAS